jgi:hypothetical protein
LDNLSSPIAAMASFVERSTFESLRLIRRFKRKEHLPERMTLQDIGAIHG